MILKTSLTSFVCAITFLAANKANGQVGINTTSPDTNSALDIVHTKKGILIPRMTQTQVNDLVALNPADGMLIYNSTAQCVQIYKRTSPTVGTFDCLVVASKNDPTNDAWINDNTAGNKMVKLGTLSDGTTTRPIGTEFVAKDDGKVGIGTASPVATLHVQNGDFRLENEDNWNGYKGITYADAKYPQLFLFQARGTKSSPTYPQNGTTLGVFKSANAIDQNGGAGFRIKSTEQQSASAHGTSMSIFTTANGMSDNIDRFIVDHNGNVGIGTDSPNSKLHVRDLTGTGQYLLLGEFYAPANVAANYNTTLRFGVTNTSKNSGDLRFNFKANSDDTNSMDFAFNGIAPPRMSIQAGGNVGIGTTSPSATLDVNGRVEITTVDNVPNNTTYKPLVWNTSTQRVETTADNSGIRRVNSNVASGATVNVGSALTGSTSGSGYEIKIVTYNGCGVSTYNKFMATGTSVANYWKISYIAGISENGPSTGTSSGNGAAVNVSNPLSGGCADGGSGTALNYRVNISSSGQLSITNNGNIDRTYKVIIEKAFD